MKQKLKVLWFCNTPANAANYFSQQTIRGGWLKALNQTLQFEVDLHIAFFNPKGPKHFKFEQTNYYSIMPSDWEARLILKNLINYSTERNDTKLYNEIITQVQPDIIHIFGSESGFIRICNKVNIPILLSIQGIVNPIHDSINKAFSDKLLRRTKKNKGFNKVSLFPIHFIADKRLLKHKAKLERTHLKYIKYVEGRTAWDYRVSRILSPQSEYFIANRVLRDAFYLHHKKEYSFSKLIIHTTTSNGLFKGIETICESAFHLKQMNIPYVWNVAGINSHDPIFKLVSKKTGIKNPQKYIQCLGKKTAEQLVELLINSSIYVSASHIENSPNNVAEAMIIGLPCIASNVGGTNSYIENNISGITFQDGDSLELAGAILELRNNAEKAIQLGKKARQIATIKHAVQNVSKSILNIYNKILTANE